VCGTAELLAKRCSVVGLSAIMAVLQGCLLESPQQIKKTLEVRMSHRKWKKGDFSAFGRRVSLLEELLVV
jgi:hypothetical protein